MQDNLLEVYDNSIRNRNIRNVLLIMGSIGVFYLIYHFLMKSKKEQFLGNKNAFNNKIHFLLNSIKNDNKILTDSLVLEKNRSLLNELLNKQEVKLNLMNLKNLTDENQTELTKIRNNLENVKIARIFLSNTVTKSKW